MLQSLDVPVLVQAVVRSLTFIAWPATVIVAAACTRPALRGRSGRKRLRLAFRGLSAESGSLRINLRLVALPLVGLTSLTCAFAIEEEVREGPSRSIAALTSDGESSWILQAGTDHLMNVSTLSPERADRLEEQLTTAGVQSVRFFSSLTSLRTADRVLTAYVFAAPDELAMNPPPREGHFCDSPTAEPCRLSDPSHVLVDSGNGIDVGDTITLRGIEFEVVGHASSPRSLINRLVLYVNVDGFARLEASPTPYGLIAAASAPEVEALLADPDLQILTPAEVRVANEDFWAGNGTPLLLLLIGLLSFFAGTATLLGERAQQVQNRTVLGTLWAIGLTRGQIIELQFIRSAAAIYFAAPFAWVLSGIILFVANQSIIGFSSARSVGHVVAGTALLLIGSGAASISLTWANRKSRPIEMLS